MSAEERNTEQIEAINSFVFADGALGSMTAWMFEPYAGSDDTGLPLQPAEWAT